MRKVVGYLLVYLFCGALIVPPLYILIVTAWRDDLYELLLGRTGCPLAARAAERRRPGRPRVLPVRRAAGGDGRLYSDY